MSETGSAVFRAIADWAQLRREARRASRDLKDTRREVQDLDDSLGDLDKSGDNAAKGLRKIGTDARAADKDVKGLLGSLQQWSRIRAKATLGLDADRARAEIRKIKDDLAGLRVTRLTLDADTAEAKRELRDVQGELARLRTQPTTAKVEADIAAALARIDELKARIAGIRDARLRVDADTARARAALAATSRDADQLGRKRPTVRVDVDSSRVRVLAVVLGAVAAAAALIGPAVGVVASLAGALVSVASAAAPAVAGLAGVAAMAGAVAQAAGVAAVALSGVSKAVKALQTRQATAGSAAVSSAKQQQAAADRIAAAQRGVTRAVEQRNRTAIQGGQAVTAAERSLASAVESSARRVAAAERAHADAVRDVERARADLNRELDLAKDRMQDLALAAKGGALDEEAAQERVERAEQDLARVRRLGGSGLDLREAVTAHKQAVQNLEEIQARNEDLAEQQQRAAREGVDGDEQVIAARERLADATRAAKDAEDEREQAERDGLADVARSREALDQAAQQAAWANADAQHAVTDATRELAAAYRDAGAAAESGGAGRAADDFDKAGPAAQRFARFLNDEVLPALRRVRDEIQARALPKFEDAIRIALPLLDLFSGRLGTTADIIGDLTVRGAQMMTSGPWTRDFGAILDSNNRIIETLGSGALVTMDALRILWVVTGPLAERLSLLVLRGLETARAFLEAKRSSGELAGFMTRAGDVIEQLVRIIGNFLAALGNIGKAAAPAGQILLDSLDSVTRKFREFTGSAEGQNKLRQYFLDMIPTVQELGRLFVDVVRFFAKLGSDPNTTRFVEQLRTQLLPALERMIESLGDDVVPLMIEFATALADIVTELGGGALVGFLVTLTSIAKVLDKILSIPGLGEFVGFFLMLAGAGFALKLVAAAVTGIIGPFKLLNKALQATGIDLGKVRDSFTKTGDAGVKSADRAKKAWKSAGVAIGAVIVGTALDSAFDEGPADKKQTDWSASEKASDAADTAGKALSLNLGGVLDKIKRDIDNIPADITAMNARWGPAWNSVVDALKNVWDKFTSYWDDLGSRWEARLNSIKSGAQEFWDWLVYLFSGTAINDAWNHVFDGIKGTLSGWIDWGKKAWTDFWDLLWGKTEQSGTEIGSRISRFRDDAKAFFQDAMDTAGRIWDNGWNFLTGTTEQRSAIVRGGLQALGDAIGVDLVGAWDRGVGAIGGFIDNMQRKVEQLVAFIERQIDRATAALSRLGQSVQSGLDRAARAILPGYATGGLVGGQGNGDDQIIRATAGEFVVSKEATRRWLPLLKALNFGNLRSVTQIIQPQQAKLIQDRLAGVPDLSALAGLRELATNVTSSGATNIDNSDHSRGINIQTTVINPIAEVSSDSIADRMRTLSLMGVFS